MKCRAFGPGITADSCLLPKGFGLPETFDLTESCKSLLQFIASEFGPTQVGLFDLPGLFCTVCSCLENCLFTELVLRCLVLLLMLM